MIIKGSPRGQSAADTARLAKHLLAAENEAVAVLELKGVGADALPGALAEMRAISMATRTRRPLYHASISVTPDESRGMAPGRWIEAADALEQALGLTGHQRVLVQHVKKSRVHLHVVWSRVHPVTLKVAHDAWTYARHEACARTLEARWRLKPVIGAHSRPKGIERPRAAMSHQCWQAQERTGVPVADIADALRRCWDASPDGRSFAARVHLAGLRLARGRRGIVAVDAAGTPHSLGRRLGLKAADVRRKLADLDPAHLPDIDTIKAAPARPSPRRTIIMSRPPRPLAAAASVRRPRTPPRRPLDPDYWTALGHAVEPVAGTLLVTLPGGLVLEDRGDQMLFHGTPTPEDTAALVAAAKARGWEAIRFTGGTPKWQRAARLEALKQGFPLDAISLECEDGQKPPVAAPADARPHQAAPRSVRVAGGRADRARADRSRLPAMTGRADKRLAPAVASLFRDCPPHKPRGALLWQAQRDLLDADRPLAAYFKSVAEAGDDGWREELVRMRAPLRDIPPHHRGDPMNIHAISAMMPTWRTWGQILLDREAANVAGGRA